MMKDWHLWSHVVFVLGLSLTRPGCRLDSHRRYLGERPDVLLIVVDALRRDALGLYGSDQPTTPFLDALADSGVAFTGAYAQAPQTFFSTATLMTSRYFPLVSTNRDFQPIPGLPEDLQRRHAQVPYLSDANRTLAEVLLASGYQTLGLFTNPHHHPTSGFWQGFEQALYLPRHSAAKPYARAPQVVKTFLEWHAGREDHRPYFAYLHLMDVHAPYNPPLELRRKFVRVEGTDRYMTGKPAGDQVPSAEDLAYMRGLYNGEVRFVDEAIRYLVAELKHRHRWQNTLLILTSDHGDEFMDHGGLGHGTTLEKELLHIPLILAGAHLSALPSAQRRPEGLVRNLDLMPTILAVAGVDEPPELDGKSLVPLLSGTTNGRWAGTSFARIRSFRSLTDRKWHFISDLDSGASILYDNETDPAGEANLSSARPEVVRRFRRGIETFESWRREAARAGGLTVDGEQAAPQVDPAIIEQLKALGYL